MITKDDIEAFRVAEKFCERAERGLPPDRWATTAEMHKVARAYQALYALAWGIAKASAEQEYKRGLESIRMENEP